MNRFCFSFVFALVCPLATAQEVGSPDLSSASGIDHTTVAIIINTSDPLSLAIGEYYARARLVPPTNVIKVSFPVGQSEISLEEFQRIKAEVDSVAPNRVQAYALAWSAPYRVGCMSITSAFAFGYDNAYCASGCRPTRLSNYFNSASRLPEYELHIRPAMMLAGRSFSDVKALIDRGVQSDATYPRGTAYLLITGDKARSSRVLTYPQVETVAAGLVNIEMLRQDRLTDRQDVMFYFTGGISVAGLETLKFFPGAIADHLTSYGGMLTDSGQMSAVRWLEAGATGSYGTVVEPCNFPQKFPHPAIVIGRYLRGETLIEAYWKSVAWPGQGVFIGEPLATPFRLRR
jgi:uncharacterized protein (TIGR03790 family)